MAGLCHHKSYAGIASVDGLAGDLILHQTIAKTSNMITEWQFEERNRKTNRDRVGRLTHLEEGP